MMIKVQVKAEKITSSIIFPFSEKITSEVCVINKSPYICILFCYQVNNAGIIELGTIENTSLEQYDRLMNTNVR